jgi:hypothetical protein
MNLTVGAKFEAAVNVRIQLSAKNDGGRTVNVRNTIGLNGEVQHLHKMLNKMNLHDIR